MYVGLDGQNATNYDEQEHASPTDYLYNVLIYSNTSLSNGNHTVTISPDPTQGVLLFDYVTYT